MILIKKLLDNSMKAAEMTVKDYEGLCVLKIADGNLYLENISMPGSTHEAAFNIGATFAPICGY